MTIGVECGALSVNDSRLKVGVYRVVRNLLQELAILDKDNLYRLYSFAPLGRGFLADLGPNMQNIVLKPTRGWFSWRLPLELRLRPVDIFLGVSQALPSASAKKIGFIYDLGFLHYPEAYPGSLSKLKKQTAVLVRRADQIVTISQAVKADILEHYDILESKIHVCYPGVDKRFSLRGEILQRQRPYFLMVGALKPGKNIPLAIKAFFHFKKLTKVDYELVIIGSDYWLDQNINDTIKQLNLEDRVQLLGFLPDEKLPPYYRGAMALMAPSLWEGFCLPALEAMACGCPVIASTSGAFPEVVEKAGILVNPHDIWGFTKALRQITSSKTLYTQFKSAAAARAKQFTWRKFALGVQGIIKGVNL